MRAAQTGIVIAENNKTHLHQWPFPTKHSRGTLTSQPPRLKRPHSHDRSFCNLLFTFYFPSSTAIYHSIVWIENGIKRATMNSMASMTARTMSDQQREQFQHFVIQQRIQQLEQIEKRQRSQQLQQNQQLSALTVEQRQQIMRQQQQAIRQVPNGTPQLQQQTMRQTQSGARQHQQQQQLSGPPQLQHQHQQNGVSRQQQQQQHMVVQQQNQAVLQRQRQQQDILLQNQICQVPNGQQRTNGMQLSHQPSIRSQSVNSMSPASAYANNKNLLQLNTSPRPVSYPAKNFGGTPPHADIITDGRANYNGSPSQPQQATGALSQSPLRQTVNVLNQFAQVT